MPYDDLSFDDPKGFASGLGLLDNEDPFSDPQKLAGSLGLLGDYLRKPAGSVVSGSPEDLYGKYRKILEDQDPSTDILQGYLSRRPKKEDYALPSQGKWFNAIAGFGAGARGASPYTTYAAAQHIADEPWLEAMKQYQDEGRLVSTAANLADRQKNNQLKGLEFGMKLEEDTRHRKEYEDIRRDADAERARKNAADEEEKRQSRLDRNMLYGQMNAIREEGVGLRREMFNDRKSREGEKLDPFQKRGLDVYKDVSSPLTERDLKDKRAKVFLNNPDIAKLFYDDKGKEHDLPVEDVQNDPRAAALYAKYLSIMKNDDRLLGSLGFGQEPYPQTNEVPPPPKPNPTLPYEGSRLSNWYDRLLYRQ